MSISCNVFRLTSSIHCLYILQTFRAKIDMNSRVVNYVGINTNDHYSILTCFSAGGLHFSLVLKQSYHRYSSDAKLQCETIQQYWRKDKPLKARKARLAGYPTMVPPAFLIFFECITNLPSAGRSLFYIQMKIEKEIEIDINNWIWST